LNVPCSISHLTTGTPLTLTTSNGPILYPSTSRSSGIVAQGDVANVTGTIEPIINLMDNTTFPCVFLWQISGYAGYSAYQSVGYVISTDLSNTVYVSILANLITTSLISNGAFARMFIQSTNGETFPAYWCLTRL
jgi:hypothetical protein